MAAAATEAELERIIYLSGLGDSHSASLSKHLQSRHEVGEILQSGIGSLHHPSRGNDSGIGKRFV